MSLPRIVLSAALAATLVLPACGKGGSSKWSEHTGDLPFLVGYDAGVRAAKVAGKPPMLFFTAHW